jgi:AmiR/NasT family two-component response regulator
MTSDTDPFEKELADILRKGLKPAPLARTIIVAEKKKPNITELASELEDLTSELEKVKLIIGPNDPVRILIPRSR